MKQHTISFPVATAMVFCGLGTSTAGVIDFSTIAHGEIVNTQIPGITVTAENFTPGHPDLAIGFDTGETGTADPDLEPPWLAGNLTALELATLDLGTVIIIAENSDDKDGDGLIDSPDDEGNRPAGEITFLFDDAIRAFGFDLVDIEGVDPDGELDSGEEQGQFAVFFMGGAPVGTVNFAEFLPDKARDQGAMFGNNTVNRIEPIGGFGWFDEVTIRLGGSGAIDNLVYRVPSPGVATLLALGLSLLGLVRRRRSRD